MQILPHGRMIITGVFVIMKTRAGVIPLRGNVRYRE